MRAFFKRVDGGPKSNVTGFWLIEWKRFFSIALLRFDDGARDCYHSHAFNCVSWILRGQLHEDRIREEDGHYLPGPSKWVSTWSVFKPSLSPVITTRDNLHRVHSIGTTWALTLRGPWVGHWKELRGRKTVTLTHGRKEI